MSWSTTPPAPIIKPGWTTDPTIHIPGGNQQWEVRIEERLRGLLHPLSAAMVGEVRQQGDLAVQLKQALFTGTGAQSQHGALATNLQPATFLGTNITMGQLAGNLSPATVSFTGGQQYTATMAASLRAPTIALSGQEIFTGTITAELQNAIAALTGTQGIPGTMAAQLKAALAAANGGQTITGQLAAALRNALFTGSAQQIYTGSMAAAMKRALFTGTGSNFTPPPVTYSTTGAGGTAQGGNSSSSVTTSWSHTIGADDSAVLIGVSVRGARPNSDASSATCGGVTMTRLGQIANGGTTIAIFGLLNPPTGTQTMSVTGTWTSGLGANGNVVEGNSVSYDGVAAFGTVTSNTGSGNPTITVSSATKRMVFNMIGAGSALVSPTLNQTQRWKINTAAIQDAAGAASVTLGATYSFSPGAWASLAVDILPA